MYSDWRKSQKEQKRITSMVYGDGSKYKRVLAYLSECSDNGVFFFGSLSF